MVDIVKWGGRAPLPQPHWARLIFPSLWNVRQKVALATLCVLCDGNISFPCRKHHLFRFWNTYILFTDLFFKKRIMLCRKLTLPPSPFTPFVNGFSSNKIVYAVDISAEIWAYRENIQHAAEIHILHSTRKFVG